MLSCKDVLKELSAVETGEPTEGAVRDHLASCEACRAEAARVRAELESLRGELAALAPSPFLEDTVLQAAREETGGVRAPRRWLPAGIGVAAAAVLAFLVFVAKQPEQPEVAAGGGPFGKDAEGPTLIAFPPTAAQAAAARKARGAKATGSYEHLFFRMPGAPPPGMAVIGRRLLAQLAPKPDAPHAAKAAFDRLTQGGREVEPDITLGAPGWKGAACRVRARLVLEYDGWLIVEETLARALGLHEHERLGGVTIGGDTSMRGEQARAQVRVDGRDVTTNCEVLREGAPLPAHPLQSGGLPQAQRIVIEGERPNSGSIGDDIDIHHAHGTSFIVTTRVKAFSDDPKRAARIDVERSGPYQIALQYNAGKHPQCLVFLPHVDVGGGGVLAWAFRMERVTLSQRFEPGAAVTIARVWHGRTAIPSRESVAHTWADEQGRVSYVHQRGERGPLRARELLEDGSVRWHEIALPAKHR